MTINQVQRKQAHDLYGKISKSPKFFVNNVMGEELEDYQLEIMNSVRDNPITTVRSCHDTGKSFTAARLVHWFLQAHPDCIVVTTAPTGRQVEKIIWREVRGSYQLSKMPLGGRILKTELELGENWYAIGVSSDDSDKIQGFHPKSGWILVIVDEAAGVSEDVFLAADAIMSSEGARLLMIGNPTSVSGTFYNSHHSDHTSSKIKITCFDTPNFKNNGIANLKDLINCDLNDIEIIKPHLITPAWAKDKIIRWGIDSPMFQARVLGQFPTAEENTLIPLNFIEAATEPERRMELTPGVPYIGVDPARYGNDKTVITPRYGPIVEPQIVHGKENTSQTAGRVKLLHSEMAGVVQGIFIDSDGVGGGVADQLIEDKFETVVEIYNNATAMAEEGGLTFVNLRSQLYWHLAELFKRGEIWIPPDSELMAQLSSIRYFITRRGISVEHKDDIRKRLKISPDKADSLAYSFASFLILGANATRPSVGKSYDEMYNERKEH